MSERGANALAGGADPVLVAELVDANRILFDQGVVDGFGHVSVRHNARPDRFLLSRSMAPGLVSEADILEYDMDGEPIVAGGPAVYLERYIHSEIYRARPDVISVVHSHSPSVIPFGIVKSVPLQPVFHMAGFLGGPTPIFEIRDTAGEGSDMLIRDRPLGAALAASIGGGHAALMRGHGSTVVGKTLRQAVYRAVYMEVNARLQAEAIGLGEVTYLTPAEAKAAAAVNDATLNRAWELWKMRAGRAGHTG